MRRNVTSGGPSPKAVRPLPANGPCGNGNAPGRAWSRLALALLLVLGLAAAAPATAKAQGSRSQVPVQAPTQAPRSQPAQPAASSKPWTQEELALELSAVLDLRRNVSQAEAGLAALDLPATLLKFKTDALIMVIESVGDLLALDNAGAQYKSYVNSRLDRLSESLSRVGHYQGLPSLASDARMVDLAKRIDARISTFQARLDAMRQARR